MAFPQASDYRPPIIPDGEVYDNPENGKSYYWTQILLPEGSTPDTATSIGGYWTVVCEDNQDHKYLLKHGDDVTDAPALAEYYWDKGVYFNSASKADSTEASKILLQPTQVRIDSPAPSGGIDIKANGAASLRALNSPLGLSGNSISISSTTYATFDAGEYLTLSASAGNAKLRSSQSDVILEASAGDINLDAGAGDITLEASAAGKEAVVRTIDDTSDSKQITNKEYVDERDELLQQEIIELEEEIDAIAPSTQRGEWHFDKDKSFPDPGDYYLLKGASGANPEATEFYNEADGVVFHNVDANGVNNTWSNVAVDELIQIFDKPDPDFVLGTITNVDKNKISNAVWIEFDRISAEGSPNNNPDIKLSRINIFEAPTGGDVTGFVLKTGDTMTGNLTIDRSTGTANVETKLTLTGERSNTTNPAAAIKFENKNSTTAGYLTYKSYDSNSWFTFTQDVDLNNKGLHSVARLRLKSGGYIGAGSDERIKIRTGGGNDNQAGTEIQRFGENKRIFAIRGKIKDATSESDILWAYANTGKTGDAINYRGLVTHDYHITNRGYVRNNYVKGNYTITKSNGNYYIS